MGLTVLSPLRLHIRARMERGSDLCTYSTQDAFPRRQDLILFLFVPSPTGPVPLGLLPQRWAGLGTGLVCVRNTKGFGKCGLWARPRVWDPGPLRRSWAQAGAPWEQVRSSWGQPSATPAGRPSTLWGAAAAVRPLPTAWLQGTSLGDPFPPDSSACPPPALPFPAVRSLTSFFLSKPF